MKCMQCGTEIPQNSERCICRGAAVPKYTDRIPAWIYLFGALIAVMVIISYLFLPRSLNSYKTVATAIDRANDGYIYSTLSALDEIAAKRPSSNVVPLQMMKIAMDHEYYSYAAYIYQTYLEGDKVSDSIYLRLESYAAVLDRYYNTYDAYDQMLSEITDSNEMSENHSEKIVSKLEALLEDPSYEPAVLYYYMGYSEIDQLKRRKYFEQSFVLDPKNVDTAVQIGNSYRREGDLETAESYISAAYQIDKEAPTTIRSLAILELLKGNIAEGVSYAKQAYEMDRTQNYVADTYLVSLKVNGEVEQAHALMAELEQEDFYFDDSLRDFLDGKLTLEEYYID
ncbi:MAG: hypothetical protein GX567_16510 [Clostridia bacterium]|nr:hypothetical protein [Clostridia bacterium]